MGTKKFKKALTLVISLGLLFSICFPTWGGIGFGLEKDKQLPPYAPGEVIVVFEKGVSLKKAERAIEEMEPENAELLSRSGSQIAQLVELPENRTVEEAVEVYESNPDVDYAQPNFRYTLNESARPIQTFHFERVEPQQAFPFDINDPYFSNLWHFTNISVESAWSLLEKQKHKKVKVAVLDTGVDLSHEDLQTNLNTSLCKDTSSGTSTTQLTGDLGSHGTHVSGIIAATANNNKGVAGVGAGSDNSVVTLFVVKVFVREWIPELNREAEIAYTDGVVRGIEYAREQDAKVINMSLGYDTDEPLDEEDEYLESACNAAVNDDITVVCAAGNDNNTVPNYPADFPACISVISTTASNLKAGSSNYGEAKDISAPGQSIYSTIPTGNKYGSKSGTSMAAPVVSAAAAMLYSVNPDLNVDQIKELLYTTAIDIYTPGWDASSGWGIVNPNGALRKLTGYQIKYILNGGINAAGNPTGYTEMDKFPITIKNPVRVGYLFGGWTVKYEKPEIPGITTPTANYSIPSGTTGDITLTATWEKVTVDKTSIKSLKKSSPKSLKVNYTKVAGANGYQIQYADNKKFNKAKTVNAKGTTVTLKKLKAGKKYYVRVRAWKSDSTEKKIYGKYSAVKAKKI